jgi:hypothetical protein
MRWIAGLAVAAAFPVTALAQAVSYPPAERQIAAAVSPLPEPLQKGAKVLGYDASGKLVTLRPGTNEMICLADNPTNKRFHVSCYHQSLDAFMSRGRELRAQNMTEDLVDSTRAREVRAKTLVMPSQPAALHQYFAARDSVDATTGAIKGAQYLYVVYTPYATYKTTGISEAPVPGGPWIMFPGTPFAHLMISPQKPATIELKQ